MKIGVLSIQGDVRENIISTQAAMEELGIEGTVTDVRKPEDISSLDGIILPGGESTTIGQLSLVNGSMKVLKEKIAGGMPVLGICAGLIMLAKDANDRVMGRTEQPLLDILDVKLERNSFGRQKESFEAPVSMDGIGIPEFNGVFIRAPSISDVGDGVEALARLDGRIVAVKKENVVGTAFHPELTEDVALHKYFVDMVNSKN